MARSITRPRGFTEGPNRTWALAASIGLAVIAAVFAFAALRAAGGSDSTGASTATTQVLVATRAIKAGDAIPADALRVASLPSDAVIKTALTSLEGLAPNLVAAVGIENGEQITPSKVGLNRGDRAIPPGMRLAPVSVTEDKIFGGLLAPGDHVDVMVVIAKSSDTTSQARAETLVQNAEVWAVGQRSLQPTANLDKDGNPIATNQANGVIGTTPSDTSAQPDAKTVALIVTPQDSLRIALAQEEATVWLSLRAPGDNAPADTRPQQLPAN